MNQFWSNIDKLISTSEIINDRPAGSRHPRHPEVIYPLDCGHLKNSRGPDGAGLGVWKGSEQSDAVGAVLCTVDTLKRDSETKLLIGCTEAEQSRILDFYNSSESISAVIIKRPSVAEGNIVIINGPAGVGKTTIARALSKYGRNSVVVEGDSIKRFVVNRNDGEVGTGLGYLNGATVSSNYIRAGYDLVIFEYVFEDGTHLPKFLNNLTVDCPVYLFTLWAELTTVVSRELMREKRDRLGPRIAECWTAMKKNLSGLGSIISTENRRTDEIVASIMEKVNTNEGRIEEQSGSAQEKKHEEGEIRECF